jgi:regulator of sigma E protease
MADWVPYIIPAFIISMTIVVFVHELGHFLAARYFGVRVEAFSIGFGRPIGWGKWRLAMTDRYGTQWKVGWIPLGGYVKFWGDEGVASGAPDHEKLDHATAQERSASFHFKPVYQRAIIAVAGPAANFVLSFVVFSALAWSYGDLPAKIGDVVKGMPAEQAGIQVGDVVEAIDGAPVLGFQNDLMQVVTLNEGRSLRFDVRRGEQRLSFNVTPVTHPRDNGLGSKIQLPAIGVRPAPISGPEEMVRFSVGEAVWRGYKSTSWFVSVTLQFIGKLVTGTGDTKQLSGPIGIAKVSGQVLGTAGIVGLISLIAVLSVSIGLLNLFPIPMLDGGHLAMYAVEAIRGRPLGERLQERLGLLVGIPLLLLLMVVATTNDLVNLPQGMTKQPVAQESSK